MSRTIVIKARITPEMKAALETASEQRKWSESLIVSEALEAWLENWTIRVNSSKPKAR